MYGNYMVIKVIMNFPFRKLLTTFINLKISLLYYTADHVIDLTYCFYNNLQKLRVLTKYSFLFGIIDGYSMLFYNTRTTNRKARKKKFKNIVTLSGILHTNRSDEQQKKMSKGIFTKVQITENNLLIFS